MRFFLVLTVLAALAGCAGQPTEPPVQEAGQAVVGAGNQAASVATSLANDAAQVSAASASIVAPFVRLYGLLGK